MDEGVVQEWISWMWAAETDRTEELIFYADGAAQLTKAVSAHGPAADTGEEQVRLWWDTLAAELATVAQDQNVVLLIGANECLNDEAGAVWRPKRIWLARP